MGCLRVKLRDLGRYQKKYPLVRNEPKQSLVSDSTIEMETRNIEILDSSQAAVIFEQPFTAGPNVVVGFISVDLLTFGGSVNVYATDITRFGCTVRTSADISGEISLQAIYIP